ncbi:MAG: inositol-3-phosphate synthase [Elusimicrobia bacterium RIFCSPLOWO2_01_FULL_64_13]|nr:MAG: inositol-3-phosphate synthase [Elusimicrobia bacterium RIFCSPLOWO2_01_FULL_64_13]
MSEKTSFYPELEKKIIPPRGKLGVLMPGLGAVATTFIAGVVLARKKLARPFGSLTQMQRIRLGKRTSPKFPLIREFVPLAGLEDLVFGGWDIYGDNAYETAVKAGVLPGTVLEKARPELSEIRPMPAVFDRNWVKKLDGRNVKAARNKMDLAEELVGDIERFKSRNKLSRAVMVWCGSTEVYSSPAPVHRTLSAFERGLKENAPEISPSMIYAYAALRTGTPYANGAPNLSAELPALTALAREKKTAIAGKDFKTGQTLMKTIVAPGLKARMLGLRGWFSTNILGNRDGEVLDDPGSFKSKEVSKASVLDAILDPGLYPELYKDVFHKIRIEYYPPRGDEKEGWDNIDIFGWCGMPMQIKINFLCRDSILAAPVVLDLALFMDLAARAGLSGIQEWLSFYFKSPMCRPDLKPEHDLFIQHLKLQNTLRILMGEEVLDHSGLDYYESRESLLELTGKGGRAGKS